MIIVNVNINRIAVLDARKLSSGERKLRQACEAILALDHSFGDEISTLWDVVIAYRGMPLHDAIEYALADLEMTLERNQSTDYAQFAYDVWEREESDAFWRANSERYE